MTKKEIIKSLLKELKLIIDYYVEKPSELDTFEFSNIRTIIRNLSREIEGE